MSKSPFRAALLMAVAAIICTLVLTLWLGQSSLAEAAGADSIIRSLAAERAKKTQPIEDPAGHMAAFYQALARTAAGQPGALTRVCHFGDSLIEMELLPGPVRRLLQKKWGDGGHGFVLSSRPKPWYRPYDLSFDPSAKLISFDMGDETYPDRRFGLGGAVGIAYKAKASLEVGTTSRGDVGHKVARFEILFPIEPAGGPIEVELDGRKVGAINSQGAGYQSGYAVVTAAEGSHELELTVMQKNSRLHGVILESSGPGVVYDALGINGSGVDTYLSVDRQHWMGQLRHRNPDMVIIGIGTNDTYFELDIITYKNDLRRLLNRVREALPDSTLLLMAPLDRAMKRGAELVTHPITPKIVATQRELAKEMGIAFWSAFDAMGGEGSMARWYRATPRLGAGDLFHPTPAGGEKLGEMFYWALMQDFAKYLEQHGLPTTTRPKPADPLKKVEIR
ncbi:MAG: GDSL-type esterase/lipase family protein [Alphaproteobacteria bacterium]